MHKIMIRKIIVLCDYIVHNLPHVPHLPPKYPQPNSHYQPLTIKAFMMIEVIATDVASSVTQFKACSTWHFQFAI